MDNIPIAHGVCILLEYAIQRHGRGCSFHSINKDIYQIFNQLLKYFKRVVSAPL